MGFAEQWTSANNAGLRQKVAIATVKVAKLIQGEIQGVMTANQWSKRAILAAEVVNSFAFVGGTTSAMGTPGWLDTFVMAVVTNPTIGNADQGVSPSSDNDIEFEITASWDDIAGVTGADLV